MDQALPDGLALTAEQGLRREHGAQRHPTLTSIVFKDIAETRPATKPRELVRPVAQLGYPTGKPVPE